MSWKTRKAAARLLSSLFSTRKEFISEFYIQAAPVVVKRFKERIESVRFEVIIAFTALVKQTNVLTESKTKGPSKKNNIGRETKKMRYDVTSSGTYTEYETRL
jgi:cullin-associated NEDD8-dissociated protein 1